MQTPRCKQSRAAQTVPHDIPTAALPNGDLGPTRFAALSVIVLVQDDYDTRRPNVSSSRRRREPAWIQSSASSYMAAVSGGGDG